jgi:hypothetical protein
MLWLLVKFDPSIRRIVILVESVPGSAAGAISSTCVVKISDII